MQKLKKIREELGLSMDEMALRLNVSTSLYEKIEYGYIKPGRGFIEKLKKVFPYVDANIFFETKVHEFKTED